MSYSKKTVAFSFSGKEGYKALDILDEAKSKGINKSGLVVDLLLIYELAQSNLGSDDVLYKMRKAIEDNR